MASTSTHSRSAKSMVPEASGKACWGCSVCLMPHLLLLHPDAAMAVGNHGQSWPTRRGIERSGIYLATTGHSLPQPLSWTSAVGTSLTSPWMQVMASFP